MDTGAWDLAGDCGSDQLFTPFNMRACGAVKHTHKHTHTHKVNNEHWHHIGTRWQTLTEHFITSTEFIKCWKPFFEIQLRVEVMASHISARFEQVRVYPANLPFGRIPKKLCCIYRWTKRPPKDTELMVMSMNPVRDSFLRRDMVHYRVWYSNNDSY